MFGSQEFVGMGAKRVTALALANQAQQIGTAYALYRLENNRGPDGLGGLVEASYLQKRPDPVGGIAASWEIVGDYLVLDIQDPGLCGQFLAAMGDSGNGGTAGCVADAGDGPEEPGAYTLFYRLNPDGRPAPDPAIGASV